MLILNKNRNMKQYLSAQEIARNKRVKELMDNRTEKKQQLPAKLTQDEMFDLKKYMSSGYSRGEAVALILETRNNQI
jgi:hypothetical protein